jgi:hypothetical protein
MSIASFDIYILQSKSLQERGTCIFFPIQDSVQVGTIEAMALRVSDLTSLLLNGGL